MGQPFYSVERRLLFVVRGPGRTEPPTALYGQSAGTQTAALSKRVRDPSSK